MERKLTIARVGDTAIHYKSLERFANSKDSKGKSGFSGARSTDKKQFLILTVKIEPHRDIENIA